MGSFSLESYPSSSDPIFFSFDIFFLIAALFFYNFIFLQEFFFRIPAH